MALVLVVEDEPQIAEILEGYLRQSGYRTERAASGARGLELYRAARPDLVLLDVMLPGMDGIEVLKAIRADGATPVILLTARSEELDKLLGLELGADDYVTKPFRPREVVARVRAVLRRAAGPEAPATLRAGPIEVDVVGTRALASGREVALTPAEFKLLQHFVQHPGRTFARAELLASALPESDALERAVDVHVGNLRRKLAGAGVADVIQTVRGMGFRFDPDA